MKIESIAHKGLKRFIERADASGLPSASAGKIRRMVLFLDALTKEDELRILRLWSAHQLTGDRKGTWSFSVTRNWRLTFRIEDDVVHGLNLEDYH